MRELPLEDPRRGRAKRWRDASTHLLARLNEDQLRAVHRARSGHPPGYVLGRYDDSVTGAQLVVPLNEIEEIARDLLRTYHWPDTGDWPSGEARPSWPASGFADRQGFEDWHHVGPDWLPRPGFSRLLYDPGSDQICPKLMPDECPLEIAPDFRGELLQLIELVAEAKGALDAGRYKNVALRMMTIGGVFCRLAATLVDGSATAQGAVNDILRHRSHASRRENIDEHLHPREAEIARLDLLTKAVGKRERATNIKKGWDNNIGLDKWVINYNKECADEARKNNTPPSKPIRSLSIDEISRKLPKRR